MECRSTKRGGSKILTKTKNEFRLAAGRIRSVAENVIALVVWPRRSEQDDPLGTTLTDDYTYDSRTTAAWGGGSPPRQPVQAHQLPPTVLLAMVVIDEESARRLEDAGDQRTEIEAALAGLFQNTPGSVEKYTADLKELESRLQGKRIGYRVFFTTVSLRESKWSS